LTRIKRRIKVLKEFKGVQVTLKKICVLLMHIIDRFARIKEFWFEVIILDDLVDIIELNYDTLNIFLLVW